MEIVYDTDLVWNIFFNSFNSYGKSPNEHYNLVC